MTERQSPSERAAELAGGRAGGDGDRAGRAGGPGGCVWGALAGLLVFVNGPPNSLLDGL